MSHLSGIILKAHSGFFTVRTDQGDFVCQLRGRLKQKRQSADLAAAGDDVEISLLLGQPGLGMIERVLPRRSQLARHAPADRARAGQRGADHEAAQVIVANPDQAVFVFACAEPAPRLRMLDRFLVMAEASGLRALICANKRDLVTPEQAEALFGLYPGLGYPVVYTSTVTGEGVDALRERLRGKLSVLAGPSGVGKSSLLNALEPGLGRRTQTVSRATAKGRHTTVYPELQPLTEGGYVADTPGLRSLALWDVEPEELDGYFVEIRPYVAECEFNDCMHFDEPGCAVRAAVEAGKIAASRYESYRRLRAGDF